MKKTYIIPTLHLTRVRCEKPVSTSIRYNEGKSTSTQYVKGDNTSDRGYNNRSVWDDDWSQ